MLLIVEPPEQRGERTADGGRFAYDRMLRFTADLKQRGLLLASASLRSSAAGVRVQVRNGARTKRARNSNAQRR